MANKHHLCQEIIDDILLQLPVKTLLRIRCVSESLRNIIDSQDFIYAHLNTSAKTRKKLILLHNEPDRVADFYAADHSGRLKDPIKLKNPTRYNDPSGRDPINVSILSGRTDIIGSCNGLILLMQNYEKFLLWNPFTTQYKVLPEPRSKDLIFTSQKMWSDVFGLGYDAASNDYKVLRIQNLGSPECSVGIYSLKSNSWRRLEAFPCVNLISDRSRSGKHVNGTLYWKSTERWDRHSLIAFDISTEKFHTMQIPWQCNHLHNFEGQLWLSSMRSVDYHVDYHKTKVSFYVREKHEATLTWSKVGSVRYIKTGQNFRFLKEGDKLLPDMEITDTCGFYDIGAGDKVWISDATICWESLVSLGNDGNVSATVSGVNNKTSMPVKRKEGLEHRHYTTSTRDRRYDIKKRRVVFSVESNTCPT